MASVADQQGVDAEHIVQDAQSDDGTLDWLPQDPRVRAYVEKDKGMYDAVNRGFRRARGELLAYLNCDEQYLPGALEKVGNFFVRHPDVDVVFGDCIIVSGNGDYLCDRRVLAPHFLHTWLSANLSFLTAATFLRRRVIDEHGLTFNPDLRDVGDVEWTLRLIKAGLRVAVLPEFVSAFTETGQNMNLLENAAKEKKQILTSAPYWARLLTPLFVLHFRLRRLRAGHYHCEPHNYSIYTLDNLASRKTFYVAKPTFRWIRQQQPAASASDNKLPSSAQRIHLR